MIFSCSNIKVIPISEDVKKIKYYNSSGEVIKTIYKKYDEVTNDWYTAVCDRSGSANKCNYTGVSINLITTINDDDLDQSDNNDQDQSDNNDQDQSDNNDQDQSDNNDQQESDPPGEFFGFDGCLGCENFND